MNKFKLFGIIVLAAGMLQSANASVIASLTFIDPTGTVSADESIEVWVRLTLDASSDPLTYDPLDSFPNGVNFDDLPIDAFNDIFELVPFDIYNAVGRFTSRSCNDTFTVGCSDAGSQYDYNTPATDTWFDFSGTINPGESIDVLLYTLDPLGGSAAPGTYELFTAGLGLFVDGEDEFGNTLTADIYRFVTDCPAANCTFSREVTAVPLPAAVWLLGSALFGLTGLSRRK